MKIMLQPYKNEISFFTYIKMKYVRIFGKNYVLPQQLIDDSGFLKTLIENEEGNENLVIDLEDQFPPNFKKNWEYFYNQYISSTDLNLQIFRMCSYFQVDPENTLNNNIRSVTETTYENLGYNVYSIKEIHRNYDSIRTDPQAKFIADLSIISNYYYFNDLNPELLSEFPLYENTNFGNWEPENITLENIEPFVLFRSDQFSEHFSFVSMEDIMGYQYNRDNSFFEGFKFKENVFEIPKNALNFDEYLKIRKNDFSVFEPIFPMLVPVFNPDAIIYQYNGKYLISSDPNLLYLDDDCNPTNVDNSKIKKYATSGKVFGIFFKANDGRDHEYYFYRSKAPSFNVDYIYANRYHHI